MYRPALRIASPASLARSIPKARASRRFISTAPPHQKSRSWKSSAARWGLAGAFVYYYNTTNVFAEEPAYVHAPPETSRESESYPTVASVSEERRAQSRTQNPNPANEPQTATYSVPDNETPAPGSPEALEQEASQEGAFNEETGEINWDCPCLGGMAYGPCGEQFRAAFSCFVFSQEEPKGVDCIEHFKAMQNCFREHPDIYGAELDDDETAAEGQAEQPAAATADSVPSPETKPVEASNANVQASKTSRDIAPSESPASTTLTQQDRGQVVADDNKEGYRVASAQKEDEEVLSKAWHDAKSSSQAS